MSYHQEHAAQAFLPTSQARTFKNDFEYSKTYHFEYSKVHGFEYSKVYGFEYSKAYGFEDV